MPPRRDYEMVKDIRNMLLSLDWISRHRYWRRYHSWAILRAVRRADMELVKASLSSVDLLVGEGDGVEVDPNMIIPLPPPPKKKLQLKITDYFTKAPKKPRGGRQLKITSFFARRHH